MAAVLSVPSSVFKQEINTRGKIKIIVANAVFLNVLVMTISIILKLLKYKNTKF
jgi:hypothetical protein